MQEKRRSIRISKPLMIRYLPEYGNKKDWNFSFIKNISEAGVLFDTNKQFVEGENLRLMLKIPLDPDNWLETDGRVVESKPFMGNFFLTSAKFTSLKDSQKTLIKDYVEWFLSTQNSGKQINSENDKRKATRIYKNLMVSYGVQDYLGVVKKWDITTVKNFSRIGMAFTAGYLCEDTIDFLIRVPSHPHAPLHIRGRVVESRGLKTGGTGSSETFFTRVEFIDVRKEQDKLLSDYIDWLIKNDPERPKKEDE